MTTKPSFESDCQIVPMLAHHIDDVVAVHLSAFKGFFLSFLGPRFLHLLYSEIIKTPGNISLVAWHDDSQAVIGFVVGVTDQTSLYKRLIRQRAPAFAFASLRAALVRPSILPRLIRAFNYPRDKQKAASEALLMSLGVHPATANQGVGRLLVLTFLAEMQKHSVLRVSLTTDMEDNESTNRFYQKLGFEVYGSFQTPEGRWMHEYVIELIEPVRIVLA